METLILVKFMIYDYEIKYKNHEEILYIYLDISQEFAKLNAKTKKKKLNIKEIHSLISNAKSIDIGLIFLLTEKQYTFLQLVKGKEEKAK